MEPNEGYVMACHYDVLGIPRDADQTVIKKAYRKAALVWHPDKNVKNMEAAEKRFKQIAAAYETLSDTHERSWYDSHRESILRGGDGTADGGGNDEQHVPNLWKWFSASVYAGFGDDEGGFYAVYRAVFEEIHTAEMGAVMPSEEPMDDAPSLGTSSSSEQDFRRFYNFWDSFTTRISFSWHDKYNPAEADNRWVRRKMEKENKKLRDAEKRKYVDEVRHLVEYVKKRDQRMIELAKRRQEEKEAKEKARLAAQAENKERFKAAKQEWEAQRHAELLEEEERIRKENVFRLADEESSSEDSESDDERPDQAADEEAEESAPKPKKPKKKRAGAGSTRDNNKVETLIWRCQACTKSFKSEKQFSNHCQSKKHKEALKKLRRKMQKEEEELLRQMELEAALAAEEDTDTSDSELEDGAGKSGGAQGTHVHAAEQDDSESSSDDSDSDSDIDLLQAFGNLGTRNQHAAEGSASDTDEEAEDNGKTGGGQTHSEAQNTELQRAEVDEEHSEADEEHSGTNDQHTETSHFDDNIGVDDVHTEACDDSASITVDQEARAIAPADVTVAANEEDWEIVNTATKQQDTPTPTGGDHGCSVCSSSFPSRNQLFKHIKATGHAIIKTEISSSSTKKKKKRTKKQGKR